MKAIIDLEIPIRTFEKLTRLSVTIHDLSGDLWPFLSPGRMQHGSEYCRAVKLSHYEERCVKLEVTELHPRLHELEHGHCHICHAGYVEWIVPIRRGDQIAAVLFAGQRMAGRSLSNLPHDQPRTGALKALGVTKLPLVVESEEADLLMEALLQLAARLAHLIQSQTSVAPAWQDRHFSDRKLAIQDFVKQRHCESVTIDDLAHRISLSPSRAAHVVRELFGVTLQELLREERVRTAAALLRTTSLPISEVSLQVGMGDVSHFHRAFKSKLKVTPAVYRRIQDQPIN